MPRKKARHRLGGAAVNSFIPWVGGKKLLRDKIVCRFPLDFQTYIEGCGGAAWTLFHKPPCNHLEVYNDCNGLLVNLFRVVREDPEGLKAQLRYVLNAREEFEYARDALKHNLPATPVQKAAQMYLTIRLSYGSALTSYAARPIDLRGGFPLIDQVSERLRHVVIENRSFETLIPLYDSAATFFYFDPPYHTTENYYQNIGTHGFTESDHILLRDLLVGLEGRFLLSYNDDAFIRSLYDVPGIYIEPISRLHNLRQRYEPHSQFSELFISNYNTSERAKKLALEPRQLTLFEPEQTITNEEIFT